MRKRIRQTVVIRIGLAVVHRLSEVNAHGLSGADLQQAPRDAFESNRHCALSNMSRWRSGPPFVRKVRMVLEEPR
jgi:hypothetical protein